MRILQLSKKFPFPIKDGECLAITELAKSLTTNGAKVTLLAMDTVRHPSQACADHLNFYQEIIKVQVDNSIKPWHAFRNLFSSKSYHIERFESEAYREQLKTLLSKEDFDFVQLETCYLAPYIDTIRKYSNAKIVLRTHNVEHEIWERITRNIENPIKKLYLNHLSKKLKNFELAQLDRIDYLAAISQRDLKSFRKLGYKGSSVVVPIGLKTTDYEPSFSSYKRPISIGFIGSLDWMPNQEGIKWFIDNMWENLRKEFPQLTLHIAGRNAPGWIKSIKAPGIHFAGEVESAKAFINQNSIMLVPLLSGSGMRAKILEGMALGKVVLTTSIGLEGIEAKDKEEVLIANNLEEFKASLDYCYTSNGSLEKMGHRAVELIENNYNRDVISKAYIESLEEAFLSNPV